MKKTFILLLTILLAGGITLQAEPVSESRAREIAKKVLAAQPATKASSSDIKLIWNGEDVATKAAGNPAFYVYGGDRGGFVIIAGDDNVPPVLAISETNRFKVEGMPENVKWWMERMKVYVRSASPTQEVKQQWAMFAETKDGLVTDDPLEVTNKVDRLTPEWNQGNSDHRSGFHRHVFNAKCPYDKIKTDSLSLVGCVAVAAGEVLAYQSATVAIPSPTGTVGGYSVTGNYVAPAERVLTGTGYDWEHLRTLTDIKAIKAVVDANTVAGNNLLDSLAQLLADLGAMAYSLYSLNGTSANYEDLIVGLGEHMGMNKAANYARAVDYSSIQWIQKLQNEINARPFLYCGVTPDGAGHAFVFDGYGKYAGLDVFHVNFGWGGDCNGYYYYYNIDAGTGYDFTLECGAIFDLYPAPSSTYPKILKLMPMADEDPYPSHGLRYAKAGYPTPVAPNDSVLIDSFYVWNIGMETYTGTVRLVAVDRYGNVKQIFNEVSFNGEGESLPVDVVYPIEQYDYQLFYYLKEDNLHLGYSPLLGDKIIVQYTTDQTDPDKTKWVWKKVDSVLNPGDMVDELPLLPAAFIKTEDMGYNLNDWFKFELVNNDYLYSGTVWKITEPDGTVIDNLPQSNQLFILPQTGTYKIEAAVAPEVGEDVVETITTYITVSE